MGATLDSASRPQLRPAWETTSTRSVHPRTYPHWCCRQAEDEQDCCHQEGLPALRQEVQQPEGVQVCPLQEGLLQILSARCCTENENKSWPSKKKKKKKKKICPPKKKKKKKKKS